VKGFPDKIPHGPRIKAGGIGQYFDQPFQTGKCTEVYESTCAHAWCGQHITSFPSLKEMMNHVDICRGCMRLICLTCVGKPCLPAEKEVERMEMEYRLRGKIELSGWGCYEV
jgi:hypothetical protein